MKYVVFIDYDGKAYHGWQVQPHALSVQGVLEKNISTLLRTKVSIIGCGRTDAGVHARNYPFHMECPVIEIHDFKYHLNAILPNDVSINSIYPVGDLFHARFGAITRSYTYHIHGRKNPFSKNHSWYFRQFYKLDFNRMRQAAMILLEYELFFPFCKTGHDAKSYLCVLWESRLEIDEEKSTISYHITSNRFLRGMVRLIVGMLIQVGLGQLSIEQVCIALDKQERLTKPLSAPAHGLFFMGASYPANILEIES